jgi:hypothetical protein
MQGPRHQPRPRSRPEGAVQTLGGRRSGGTRDSAVTCDGVGSTRELTTMPCRRASDVGGGNGWKHFTRQLPISGQTFWGQSGQGLAGLWHGISPVAAVAVIGPAMARTTDVVIGTEISAPSMAIRPRATNQRWNRRFLTKSACHSLNGPASVHAFAFLISELAVIVTRSASFPASARALIVFCSGSFPDVYPRLVPSPLCSCLRTRTCSLSMCSTVSKARRHGPRASSSRPWLQAWMQRWSPRCLP